VACGGTMLLVGALLLRLHRPSVPPPP